MLASTNVICTQIGIQAICEEISEFSIPTPLNVYVGFVRAIKQLLTQDKETADFVSLRAITKQNLSL